MNDTKIALPSEIKYRDLKVRDVVECFDGAWSTGVITRIADGQVCIERPFGRSDDSGSLFVGIERFVVYRDSDRSIKVVRRPADD